jgi:hypothetical protein
MKLGMIFQKTSFKNKKPLILKNDRDKEIKKQNGMLFDL